MKSTYSESSYSRAIHRVEKLRGFYAHAAVYLIVNICISVFKINRNVQNGETFNEAFFDFGTYYVWLFWGIGLALHAFKIFGLPFLLGKNWEEEKIKQFMDEDQRGSRN